MVQMNLFAGQDRDGDVVNGLMNRVGEGRVGQIERLGLTHTYYHV